MYVCMCMQSCNNYVCCVVLSMEDKIGNFLVSSSAICIVYAYAGHGIALGWEGV